VSRSVKVVVGPKTGNEEAYPFDFNSFVQQQMDAALFSEFTGANNLPRDGEPVFVGISFLIADHMHYRLIYAFPLGHGRRGLPMPRDWTYHNISHPTVSSAL